MGGGSSVLLSTECPVTALAHHDLCNDSPPQVEAVYLDAAVVGPECDAAASMPQPQTLLDSNSSLVLQ